MNRDQLLASAAFALALAYYAIAATIPPSLLADAVGPEGLPKTYGVLLGGLSLILGIRSLTHTVRLKPDTTSEGTDTTSGRIVRSVRLQPDPGPAVERQKLLRVAGLLAIGAAYVVVVRWLGYMLSLAALITATMYYQGGALKDRNVVLVAVSGSIAFWLLFVLLLGIPQPPGFWSSL